MKTSIVNIKNGFITVERAKAEAGDPRGLVEAKRNDADIKIILMSCPYADGKKKQQTFYFKEIV